jgi:Protein of unknown function (DUF1566)
MTQISATPRQVWLTWVNKQAARHPFFNSGVMMKNGCKNGILRNKNPLHYHHKILDMNRIRILLLWLTTALLFQASGVHAQSQPNIGDTYKGGIVFYVLTPKDPGYDPKAAHGLIAYPSDLGGEALWADAKKLCSGLRGGNFKDWRLPSKDELKLLYAQKGRAGKYASGDDSYWSGTKEDGNIYMMALGAGVDHWCDDESSCKGRVRAVRSF